jgi:hypothetical protein
LPIPRADGDREALRILLGARRELVTYRTRMVNRLRALLLAGDEHDRTAARGPMSPPALTAIARRRARRDESRERAVRRAEARGPALAIRDASADLKDNKTQLADLVAQLAPKLMNKVGVGPVSGAQVRSVDCPTVARVSCRQERRGSSVPETAITFCASDRGVALRGCRSPASGTARGASGDGPVRCAGEPRRSGELRGRATTVDLAQLSQQGGDPSGKEVQVAEPVPGPSAGKRGGPCGAPHEDAGVRTVGSHPGDLSLIEIGSPRTIDWRRTGGHC